MSLAEVMEGLNADVLKALAKRLDLPKTLTRKADLIGAFDHYVDTRLEAFLGQLSATERLFLAGALAVPEKSAQAFRTALKKLGYVLPR
jgi:hypothetical protein